MNRKSNIFAILMVVVMCVFSIYIGMKNTAKNGTDGDDGLSAYEIACQNGFEGTEDEWLESLKYGKDGLSAYDIACLNGYKGTEGEWLLTLNGDDGENALTSVSTYDIYEAYLGVTGQTETEFDYDDFLIYYYSVVPKHSAKTATQIAYSSTVDICYSYEQYLHFVETGTASGETAYKLDKESSGDYYGVSAGAGVIYDMIDTNSDGNLDTAYIVTNYHVAYISGYCNNDEYAMYYSENTEEYFIGSLYEEEDLVSETTQSWAGSTTYQYFLSSSIDVLNTDEAIDYHFLNGKNGDYYGVYLYGYQTADYKLKATFVGGSADNDVAVLKIVRDESEVSEIFFDSNYYIPATIGDSSAIVGGEDVIAVGNPMLPDSSESASREDAEQKYIDAMCLSSTNGIVSVVSNDCLFESIIDSSKIITMRLMRVSAAINSGNSGGGLYDFYGNLVGIVNSKFASSSYDNVGYAIPINTVVSIANQIIKQCDSDLGTIQNTRIDILTTEGLGFEVKNGKSNSSLINDSNGNKEWLISHNIIVANLDEVSVAHDAGIKNEDIILSVTFDGFTYPADTYFRNYYDLERLLMDVDLSETEITFKVLRAEGNSLVEKDITISISESEFIELI